MQRLYPNFYSLVSAQAQPLDPRVRRRSFVWSPSVSRDLANLSYPVALTPGTPALVSSHPARIEATTSGIRKRSASHVTVRQPVSSTRELRSDIRMKETIIAGETGATDGQKSSTSSAGSTPPPPPPPGFADEQTEVTPPPQMGLDPRATEPALGPQPLVPSSTAFYTIPSTQNPYPPHPVHGTNASSLGSVIINPTGHHPVATYAAWTPMVRRHHDATYHTSMPPTYPTPLNRSTYRPTLYPYLIPVRMQTALSLQSLDKLCTSPVTPIPNTPSVKSMHLGHTARPKLVMGLRDLSCSGRVPGQRKPEWTVSQQLPPRPLRPELGTPIPVYAAQSARPVLLHTRMNSCPSSSLTSSAAAATVQYTVPCDSIPGRPLRRPNDANRRARLIDRRRTVWDLVPSHQNETIPIADPGEAILPQAVITANGITTITPGSMIQPLGLNSEAITSGLHSFSSDSGVDLVELEQRNKTSASPRSSGAGTAATFQEIQEKEKLTDVPRRRKSVNARRAHVVSAFEQSLNSMSQRLQNLTHNTAKKDSELHELRATIDALRSQTGLGLSKLWSRPQHSSNSVNARSHSDQNQTTASSVSLTGQVNQSDLSNTAVPTSQSALTSPQKVALTGLKDSETGPKKNGWFRTSIGKAFRKKSLVLPVASNNSASAANSNKIDNTNPPQSPDSFSHVNTMLVADSFTRSTQPSANDLAESTGSRTSNTDSGLGAIPKTIAAPINGLSPSNSSTSSSCSWGGAGSMGHAPGTVSPGSRTGPGHANKSGECKLPALSSAAGFDFGQAPESVEHGADGGAQGQETFKSSSFAHSPANESSTYSGELPAVTDTCAPSSWNVSQLQAELARLRGQLNERELKLTDVQLEALASTHQVNQLRDQISRLYAELQHLRSDNERLHMLVQHEAPVGHGIGPGTVATSNREPDRTGDAKLRASGPETPTNLRRMLHWNKHYLCGSEIDLLSGLDSTTVEANKATTAALWSLVSIQLTSIPHCPADGYHIGIVNLMDYTTWEGLDHRLDCMWTEYARRVDPVDRLGLTSYRLLAVRVNGNRAERPIARNPKELDEPSALVSVEGELACLVVQAQIAPESRTVILTQLVSNSTGNSRAEWALGCLEPVDQLERWLNCLEQYRCAVFYAVTECAVDPIISAVAHQLQASGHATSIVHRSLDHNQDDVTNWLQQQLTNSSPMVIMLYGVEVFGIQRFLDLIAQINDDNRLSSGSNSPGYRYHYILASLPVGAGGTVVPPEDSVPINLISHGPTVHCSASENCCWIPVGTWSGREAQSRLHHGIMQKFIHLTVNKLLDEARSGLPCSFPLMQFMSSVVQWLEEAWKRADQFLQTLNPDSNNDHVRLSPTVFDELPLIDSSQCAQSFVDCWNGMICPRLRHLWNQSETAGAASRPPDPRDWLVNTWPWKTVPELVEKSLELQPVIT